MTDATKGSDRIAKVMARAGVASRRDAERMIVEGRVTVNGAVVKSPALDVTPADKVTLDGKPIDAPQATRMWLYYKPLGLVTSEKDEKGRQTVFDTLPEGLPRVMSIGRLDLNSEGMLLLTNDGALKRRLELPETGWLRKYRVRVNGRPTDQMLAPLREGVTIEGEHFLPMDITIDKQQGANAWLTVGLREGRNREIRRAMTEVGLIVNRLIRVSYGPFRLNLMKPGEVVEVKAKVMREQLGSMLLTGEAAPQREKSPGSPDRPADRKPSKPRDAERKPRSTSADGERKPFGDRPRAAASDGPRRSFAAKPRPEGAEDRKPYKPREQDGERKPYGDRPRAAASEGPRKPYKPRGDAPQGDRKPYKPRAQDGERKPYGDRPRAAASDGPRKPYGAKPRGDAPAADRKPYKPRAQDGERKPHGDRPRAAGAETERKVYKPRPVGLATGSPHGRGASDGDSGPRDRKPRPDAGGDAGRKPWKPRDGAPGMGKPRAAPADGDRKPWKPRERDGEHNAAGPRPAGDGPRKTHGTKPQGARPQAAKPRSGGDRPTAGPRKPRGPKT